MTDDSDVDEDIRKQWILDEDEEPMSTAGVSQADRLMDQLNTLETLISDHDHTAETNSDRLDDLSERLNQLKENQNDLERTVEELRSDVSDEFTTVDSQLEEISETAGIQFPPGIRTKVTIPLAIGFLAFSFISGGTAALSGSSIPIYTQLSTAATIGLLSIEVIEFIR
jgi:hypothetical protein